MKIHPSKRPHPKKVIRSQARCALQERPAKKKLGAVSLCNWGFVHFVFWVLTIHKLITSLGGILPVLNMYHH